MAGVSEATGVSQAAPPRTTDQRFMSWSADQPEGLRHELVDGRPVAMAPERNRQALVKANVWAALRDSIRRSGAECVALPDGATVAIDDLNAFRPDAAVQCGGTLDLGAVTLDAPTIVVEVLSPSSRGVDSGPRLVDYFGWRALLMEPSVRKELP